MSYKVRIRIPDRTGEVSIKAEPYRVHVEKGGLSPDEPQMREDHDLETKCQILAKRMASAVSRGVLQYVIIHKDTDMLFLTLPRMQEAYIGVIKEESE